MRTVSAPESMKTNNPRPSSDTGAAPMSPAPARRTAFCNCSRGWLTGLLPTVAGTSATIANGLPSSVSTLIGDSAGGGLVLAVLLFLRDHGIPLPAAAACISPWADLAGTGESFAANEDVDPLISRSVVGLVKDAYLGDTPVQTPYASPLYGEVAALPPILIQVGEREMLLSDAERFAGKLRAAGRPVTLEVWPGMVHVWRLHHTRLAKAREGIQRLGAFLRSPSN